LADAIDRIGVALTVSASDGSDDEDGGKKLFHLSPV
jgi:hypothetical protein